MGTTHGLADGHRPSPITLPISQTSPQLWSAIYSRKSGSVTHIHCQLHITACRYKKPQFLHFNASSNIVWEHRNVFNQHSGHFSLSICLMQTGRSPHTLCNPETQVLATITRVSSWKAYIRPVCLIEVLDVLELHLQQWKDACTVQIWFSFVLALNFMTGCVSSHVKCVDIRGRLSSPFKEINICSPQAHK